MGRHPTHGAPSFRFHPTEVAQMESILREHAGQVPAREFLMSLAEKFSNSPERSGKISVQMKQVWNWFQNRRYALRSKLVKSPGKSHMPPNPQGEVATLRNLSPVPQQAPIPTGHNMVRNSSENPLMEFEAKSARDGAWYDVQQFLSHRYLETGNPEVLVRFAGFGQEEDEWVNIRKHVRQRSLPCEASECIVVLPGDLILCFQEGKDQALYFDAHVLDAQRRRHDVRGCRCRFLVRYDHDQSEEIVPLRKVCRRPETDYRLQQLHTANESASASVSGDSIKPTVDPVFSTMSGMTSPNPSAAIAFPSSTTINATTSVLHSAPAGISNPSPTLISASAPSLTPKSAPTSSSSLNPVLAPTPSSSSIPVAAPSPSFTPISVTTLSSTPVSAPNPSLTSSASPTPSLLPISQPTSTAIQAQSSGSALVSAPSPSPSPSSTFIATASPTPAPVSVQSSTLVAAPELAKTESDKPASSAGEASFQENNNNPGTASIIVEVKKDDSSIPETTNTAVAGSSMSLGEMSDNATETAPAREMMGSIAPNEPITVSAAVTEGAPIISTGAESSNPIASTDDSKE